MSRRILWIGGAVLLVALSVSIVGATVILLDPNDCKFAILEAVHDVTGRTLTLNGPVRLNRSLW